MLFVLLSACSDGVEVLGQGDDIDARFAATALTWSCAGTSGETSTSGDDQEAYDGVWAFDLTLSYAPDAQTVVDLPTDGACEDGLDLFAEGAGDGGHDLPDVDTPGWFNGDVTGELVHLATGWYVDNVIEDQQACSVAGDLFADGVQLTNGGAFTGASAPDPGALEVVGVTGTDADDEVAFGTDMNVSIDPSGWDHTFLHVRRESEGSLLESVTCDTTGVSDLTIGSTIWDAFSTVVKADTTMLYVGFQNNDELTTKDGQRIAVQSRVMRTVVVK